jgi:hypothetical protein
MKLLKEYENVTQRVLLSFILQQCTRCIDGWEILRRTSKWRLFFGFSEQSPLSKCKVVTELNMEEFHLQTLLFDVG